MSCLTLNTTPWGKCGVNAVDQGPGVDAELKWNHIYHNQAPLCSTMTLQSFDACAVWSQGTKVSDMIALFSKKKVHRILAGNKRVSNSGKMRSLLQRAKRTFPYVYHLLDP